MRVTLDRSFCAWLRQAKATDDAVGDLIRDVRRDRAFPRAKSLAAVKQYLATRDATPPVFDAVDAAWRRYSAWAVQPEDKLKGAPPNE